jgi:hypothetical protein
MQKTMKLVKKFTAAFMLAALVVGAFGFSPNRVAHAATNWDTTGSYVLDLNYQGTDFMHDMTLTQDSSGQLTGSGGNPAGANTYTWVVNSGEVFGDGINLTANYTATADAVTPQTTLTLAGSMTPDGKISGNWSDNYAGGQRSGTFTTVSGAAVMHTPTPTTSKVTILKYVDGSMATAQSANHTEFPMNATFTMNGTPGTGQYSLSENGYNGDPTPYQAITVDMPNGSTYSTNEVMNSTTGTACSAGGAPYSLTGYAYGNTLAEARAATPTLTAPNFENIQSDKYVIVLNDDCSTTNVGGEIQGQVTAGNGTLQVTSIEQLDTNATADNTYQDGWKYVFNITVPSDETNLTMKFADWVRTGGNGAIATANNMRISSPQADNNSNTITISGADTYSTPALHITGDLDPNMDGKQVKVTVEVKIPTGTTSGSYTTSYGVHSQ